MVATCRRQLDPGLACDGNETRYCFVAYEYSITNCCDEDGQRPIQASCLHPISINFFFLWLQTAKLKNLNTSIKRFVAIRFDLVV